MHLTTVNTKIYETKTDKTEGRTSHFNDRSWRHQYLTLNNA